MNYRSLFVVLFAFLLSLSPLSTQFAGSVYADEGGEGESSEEYMTEGELSDILINVMGLASLLPPNPQQVDVFAILLQNGVTPQNGWNPTNAVTMGTLARVLVQSMGAQGQVENPDDDGSWVQVLKDMGIEFGTVEEGIAQAKPINDPVAVAAIEPSTDPLRKVPSIRPSDEQQLGADLQPFSTVISAADIERFILEVIPPTPPEPEPTTRN